jgi:tetratricopeptide (TPR) repeat protein
MRARLVVLPLTLTVTLLTSVPLQAEDPPGPPTLAMQLWQQGQEVMTHGETAKAIDLYRASLRADPGLARNHLSLAAALLEQTREEEAVVCLDRYLAAEPTHHAVRAHQADLLLQMGRRLEAQEQYERVVRDTQPDETRYGDQLVHCESRLMDLAAANEDDYGERLHRGMGLYYLAHQACDEGPLTHEGLLFKAAGELGAARLERPDEARPCWYLHLVWKELGQQQPANRWLHAAAEAAPFTSLTPHEKCSLEQAYRLLRSDGRHR